MSVWPLKEVCSDWPIVRPTMYFCVFVFVFVTCEQKTMCVTPWESFLRLTKSETNIRQEDEPPIAIFGLIYYISCVSLHTYIHTYTCTCMYTQYMQIYRNMLISGSRYLGPGGLEVATIAENYSYTIKEGLSDLSLPTISLLIHAKYLLSQVLKLTWQYLRFLLFHRQPPKPFYAVQISIFLMLKAKLMHS